MNRANFGCSALLAASLLCTGCPGERTVQIGLPPRNVDEAVSRVNSNADRIRGAIRAPSLVSFTFRDGDGGKRRFLGYQAMLLFRPERCLRFEVRSLTGVIAEFGSNDERYWMWIEPEVRKLWWGSWAHAGDVSTKKLPISASDLLDALALNPLPERAIDGLRPVLRSEGDDHRLVFNRLGEDGEIAGVREIRVQSSPPYQPIEIVDRDNNSRVLMRAQLGNYERIGESGPFTPRKYAVVWPVAEAELRIDVQSVKMSPDLAEFCEFPDRWSGAIEPLDPPTEVGSIAPRRSAP
ncbi:MAG: hypothetical protein U1D55_02390 [Phycisphaerae bacterium]